jgi:hypothetical protein
MIYLAYPFIAILPQDRSSQQPPNKGVILEINCQPERMDLNDA